MNKAGYVDAVVYDIRRRLCHWGLSHFRDFPWRSETDPWLTFAAEFFLQRTKAAQVALMFDEFKRRFPSSYSFVDGGDQAVAWVADRLGLSNRCRFLWEAAVAFSQRDGFPPEDATRLQTLRGVGGYTASAWLSLHRGQRAVILDANVVRWLSRMIDLPYNRDPRGLTWAQKLAEQLTPDDDYRDYNYAVLDFTMTLCVNPEPKCDQCPLVTYCHYARENLALSVRRQG